MASILAIHAHPTLSEAVAEDLRTVMPQLRPERVLRIYNPVDRSRLASAADGPAPHEWMRPGSGVRVLAVVGALKPVKNQGFALKVLAELPQEFRLVLVGDGQERSSLESAARQLGLQGRVAFAGWQENAPLWMRHAETVLVPSHNEGFGLCAVEAASIGTRVIVARAPGLVEVAQLLQLETADPGDPVSWAAAVRRERPGASRVPGSLFAPFEPDAVASAYLDVVAHARGLLERSVAPLAERTAGTGGRAS